MDDARPRDAARRRRAIQANTPKGAQGALVALDRDGAVRAMVGGRDYVSTNYNRAVHRGPPAGIGVQAVRLSRRDRGGKTPEDTEVDDPVTIDGWSPRNDSRHNSGQVTLRTAFAYSLNTVAAKLGQEVGFSTVADMARRFGITHADQHASVDGARHLGGQSHRHDPRLRQRRQQGRGGDAVRDHQGGERGTGDLHATRSIAAMCWSRPRSPHEMTDLLQTAVNTGTGRAAQIGRPVAGKTGTTTASKDGWFLGFSSGLTTGVWMGRDDAKPIARAPRRHRAGARLRAVHEGRGRRSARSSSSTRRSRCPTSGSSPTRRAISARPDDSGGVRRRGRQSDRADAHRRPKTSPGDRDRASCTRLRTAAVPPTTRRGAGATSSSIRTGSIA